MGNWWLAASSQHTCSCVLSHIEFFGKISNHPGNSAPLQPRLGALQLLAFPPKAKITFEREEISDCQWDSGKYKGAVDGDSNKGFCRVFWTVEEMLGELCEVPRCLLWKGLRSLTYVHCFLYLLQWMSPFFIVHGWILSGQTSYVSYLWSYEPEYLLWRTP